MARTHSITIKLSDEEHEWIRRKAYWEGVSIAAVLRACIHRLVVDEGYRRPPDDEPQDFGYEKEMMQFCVRVQNELDGE